MKFSVKFLSTSLLTIITSVVALPQTFAADKEQSQMREIKCHVELIGGRDIIHYVNVSADQRKVLKTTLAGQKIYTYAVKGEQIIYKVNECVALSDSFNSTQAKSTDLMAVR